MSHKVWLGYFTKGGTVAGDGTAESEAFCKDLWHAVVRAEVLHGTEGEAARAERFAARVSSEQMTVMDALIQYCDMSLLYDVHEGRVYRYAIVGFVRRSLMRAILRTDWAAIRGDPTFTATATKGAAPTPPIYARQCKHVEHSASPSPPERQIYEVARDVSACPPPGMLKTIEHIVYRFVEAAPRRFTPPEFRLGKDPVFTLSKYLERLYLYTGADAYSRIVLALIYLERLLDTGSEAKYMSSKHVHCVFNGAMQSQAPRHNPNAKSAEKELRYLLRSIHSDIHFESCGSQQSELRVEYERLCTKSYPKQLKAQKLHRYFCKTYLSTGTNVEDVGEVPKVEQGTPGDAAFGFTEETVHKVLAGLVCLATKNYDDSVRPVCDFAVICGLSVSEMLEIEASLLKLLDYKLLVDPCYYKAYEAGVRLAHDEYCAQVLTPAYTREWKQLFRGLHKYATRCIARFLTVTDFIDFGEFLKGIKLNEGACGVEGSYGYEEGEEVVVRLVRRKLGEQFLYSNGFVTVHELRSEIVKAGAILRAGLKAAWKRVWQPPPGLAQEFSRFVTHCIADQISPLHFAETLSHASRLEIAPTLAAHLPQLVLRRSVKEVDSTTDPTPCSPTIESRCPSQPLLVNYANMYSDRHG